MHSAFLSTLCLVRRRGEALHSAIYAAQPPNELLHPHGQNVQPFNPSGIQRHADLPTLACVNHTHDLSCQLHGLDDRSEERIRSPHTSEQLRAQLSGRDEDRADILRALWCIVGRSQLGSQGGVHGDQSGFRGCVVGYIGRAEFSQYGGDRDDGAACFGAEHAWEESADGVEVGEEVDGEVTVDFSGCEGEDGLAVDGAGVVDEDCWDAELRYCASLERCR